MHVSGSIPSSGRFPHFKKRAFEQACAARGISYRHCPELGNKVGGIAYLLQQPEGQAALAELAAAPMRPDGATAFMCAEAEWRDCHRQVIAQRLMEHYGLRVFHIKRDSTLERHPEDHVLPPSYMAPGTGAIVRGVETTEATPEWEVPPEEQVNACPPKPRAKRWSKNS